MFLKMPTAVLWDYENVPLRGFDYKEFTTGIMNMINSTNVVLVQIHARKTTLSKHHYQFLLDSGFQPSQFTWVMGNIKNAADHSIIKRMEDILLNHPTIKQFVLLSGDKDFVRILRKLHSYRVVIVCDRHNSSDALTGFANEHFYLSDIRNHVNDWYTLDLH